MKTTDPIKDLEKKQKIILPLGHTQRVILEVSHAIVLALSLGLIVFISYDTFAGIPFLQNVAYMRFQLAVCVIFLADFFLGLYLAPDKGAYIGRRWFFFLISIPYLNIISLTHMQFGATALYFIRFIPLVRGAYSMAMVVGYFSSNRAFTLLSQYAFILLAAIYFMSLIFFYEERDVNEQVLTYWDSLYWAFLNVTTVGSPIEAVTVWGKVGTVLMAMSGMMMLPLFTVYITDRVKRMNDRQRRAQAAIDFELHHAGKTPAMRKAARTTTEGTADAPSATAQTSEGAKNGA